MARFEPEMVVTQSLLDRLTDNEPGAPIDAPMTRSQSFRTFKAALRRDLEWLLNTRMIAVLPPEELSELAHSLYMYGLRDLMALSPDKVQDRKVLLDTLQDVVRMFEPRLSDVQVFSEPLAPNSRTLRFRIEGMARVDPAPEHVTFDTVLELTSGEYEVR